MFSFLKTIFIPYSSKSPVKALAWHPHVTKLAVGLRDDSVHVYSAGNSLNPILKHKLQKHVTDLAWKYDGQVYLLLMHIKSDQTFTL